MEGRKRKRLAAMAITLFTLLAPLGALADEAGNDKQAVEVAPMVVTATRTQKTVADAPGSVSVVTQADMDKRNIESLGQALSTVPGLFYNNVGKGLMATTSTVTMRGMTYDKRVLFLLDGEVPLNDAYSGGVSYQLQSVEDVQQIEVVKGPFSSLYGGNAMGGVVNIITKMPEKLQVTAKAGYGSSWDRGTALDDLTKFYFSFGDKFKDKLSVFTSYGYKSTNGYPTSPNVQSSNPASSGLTGARPTTSYTGSSKYAIGDKGDNTWRDDQFTFKAAYDFTSQTKATVSFRRGTYHYGYDAPHTSLKDAAGNPVWSYGKVKESSFLAGDGGKEQNTYAADLETRLGKTQAKLSVGYLDVRNSWYLSPDASDTRTSGPGTVSETPSSTLNADLQVTIPILKRNTLTVGGSYRTGQAHNQEHSVTNWHDQDSKTDLTYDSQGKDRTYALFAQDEIDILENLTGYIGFRQDWWETFDGSVFVPGEDGYAIDFDSRSDSSFSPKAALVYKPFEATTLRTSIGKAFRAPTIYDLYRTWISSSTGITYASNPDLKPETVTAWDAGIEQGLWRGMTVKATYFENHMKDLIYRKTVSSTLQQGINAGKAKSQGVELEAEQKFDFGLTLFANYTYTDSKVEENSANPASEGKQLIQVPRNLFNLGASYEKGPFTASATCQYASKRYGSDTNSDVVNGVYGSYDPYTLVSAKIGYRITPNYEFSLAVDNLLDEDYFGYYQGAGRSFFAQVTCRY
jgi:iron complex outermembrane recepter protein